jgi:tRNA (mo5U34)-methyltransferase
MNDSEMAGRDLLAEIHNLSWFHSIDLGNGIVTPGRAQLPELQAMADVIFEGGLAGKSVLDIGCYDGFYTFEAYRRGAQRVVATDHYIWQDPRCRRCFDLARQIIAPDLEAYDLSIKDVLSETLGTFDIVLFLGVLYHVRDPLQVLEQIASLANDVLVVETHLDAVESERPAMTFYPGRELNDDPSNWWGPNSACVKAMLIDIGFSEVTFRLNPIHSNRGIFHARRNK